uniref:Protein SENSITIVITY TO RED LIGHT REDUCED 1-like n=1 Tax=Nicotiana tabacum TaxID=4097 RepID=A0A1S4DA38_TOBAC|nr:PREDICTED: protein SENSITIVITY TO RED LIGHT REDUCED 1-like [Nicotiana tabacum]
MKNVENSEFYAGMCSDIEQNKTFQKYLFRLLGSYSHVQVVIYAMGSIEYSFNSQFQLSVVLLLKRDFPNWIGNIQIYDPDMSPADIIVFKELGFEVLTIDENCKREVQRPTMFYMPNPCYHLIGNLLGANWSSSCINQIFLLTNTLSGTLTDMPQCNCVLLETRLRLERILDFTTEIDKKTSDDQMYTDLFLEFAWHFFDVDPSIDMETLLPATEITERKGNDNLGFWVGCAKML